MQLVERSFRSTPDIYEKSQDDDDGDDDDDDDDGECSS